MGSNSFLAKLVSYDPINQLTGGKLGQFVAPGVGKYQSPGSINNPNAGASPQAGVTPTLAAANAGYQNAAPGAGGPTSSSQVYGMNPTNQNSSVPVGTPQSTVNPYVGATQTAMQQRQQQGSSW
jgi:flagellar hook-length control protein FliK